MAKSKVRGGVKAHRAKVAARNQKLKSAQTKMQKLFNEAMQKEIEELKLKMQESSGTTENVAE
jgi:hypothetical protein